LSGASSARSNQSQAGQAGLSNEDVDMHDVEEANDAGQVPSASMLAEIEELKAEMRMGLQKMSERAMKMDAAEQKLKTKIAQIAQLEKKVMEQGENMDAMRDAMDEAFAEFMKDQKEAFAVGFEEHAQKIAGLDCRMKSQEKLTSDVSTELSANASSLSELKNQFHQLDVGATSECFDFYAACALLIIFSNHCCVYS